MTPPSWFRTPAGLVLTTVLVGCGEITAPATAKPDDPVVQLLDSEVAATLSVAVDDVVERVLPDLSEFAQPTAIAEALQAINGALQSRVPEQLTRGADLLRVALDGYVTNDEAAFADLDAVRLLFDDVQLVAQHPPLVPTSTR